MLGAVDKYCNGIVLIVGEGTFNSTKSNFPKGCTKLLTSEFTNTGLSLDDDERVMRVMTFGGTWGEFEEA
eukprot:CAMPEP_0195286550 /NCGR_PEP_ID=MMETSP0707-20130614/3971_1 /TAXON_ID=33640 /ORGANISM="Asterionellopsis glacialis, Strain CCMP134" /LENGTH=69 /DNA_ID=CAMNT_0040346207 /DNA_START=265 /DNA_END=474 /DNA_ORIENTATION=+